MRFSKTTISVLVFVCGVFVAVNGDEIVVAPGTYNELIDFLGKAITLRASDGPDLTVIDAGPAHVKVPDTVLPSAQTRQQIRGHLQCDCTARALLPGLQRAVWPQAVPKNGSGSSS